MKDVLGNEIKVGDTIAYAVRIGDSARLKVYEVQEVWSDKVKAINKQGVKPSVLCKPTSALIVNGVI